VLESAPIKGTARREEGEAGRARLWTSEKERAELTMIVDLVRNDLGRVCEWGSVTVPTLCGVEEHPGLAHLVSTVRGELRSDVGWPELLDATFPAGSITGAPKLAALALIAELEPIARGPYCGALGWVDADRGTGELNVAIRTFWFGEGRLWFGTGGGITWASDPAGEWAETELKAERLLAVTARRS
jgi:para-aminobenzoate synthetase component 1